MKSPSSSRERMRIAAAIRSRSVSRTFATIHGSSSMTSRSALRPGDLLLSAALALSGAAPPSTPQPAPSVTVPARFDCANATRAVDRFICANPPLPWPDLALPHISLPVLDSLTGPPTAHLVPSPRHRGRQQTPRYPPP